MSKINEVVEYLTKSQIMYIGTNNNGKPQVRPVGFVMEHNDEAHFTTAENSGIYTNLQTNPNIEVTAMHPELDYHRIRFSGVASFDVDSSAFDKYYELNPSMKDVPNVTLYKVTDWEATFYEGFTDSRTIKAGTK